MMQKINWSCSLVIIDRTMKRIKSILILLAALLSFPVAAQDKDGFENVERYNQLNAQIEELNVLIGQEEDASYTLRLSWYNTCKAYLQKGQFRAEELLLLINQTIPGIDGQALYDALLKAKACFDSGIAYQCVDIPAPTRNSSVHPVASSDGDNEEPLDDREATSMDSIPNPEADPNRNESGRDSPLDKKDSDRNGKTSPVNQDSPISDSPETKAEEWDRGEIRDGKSKQSKKNDGSM